MSITIKILKVFIYVASIACCFFIIILSPIIKIRFGLLPSERIGEVALRTEIYLMNKKFKSTKVKFIDFFVCTHIIANKTLIDLIKKKLLILPTLIGYPTYHLLKILSYKISFFKKFIITIHAKDYKHLFSKTENSLDLDISFIKKGEEFLNKLRINKNSKIICLIVRDDNYLKSKFPEKDWEYQNHRDCSISNYKLAVMYAIEQGYYVFHMGDKPKNYLNLKNKKFIQYARDYRTDFLDVYLAYKCEFCITMGTGWDILPAYNFRKPIVWTNLVPVGDAVSFSHKFIFAPKLYFCNQKKRYLSLKEIKDLDISFKNKSKDFRELNLSLVENSPIEIKDMTKEMINILNNEAEYTQQDKDRQEKLLKLYDEYFSYKWGNNMNQFSRISKNFIQKNQFLVEN
tara:strand:+ start:108 stop:1310 length:1203 start_codon:yes stop_codon:yes gene_type:complete